MKIAFDIKLMRPGCVLLQAGLGCDSHVAHNFDTKSWLVAPTPDLKIYEVTPEQLTHLVRMVYAETIIDGLSVGSGGRDRSDLNQRDQDLPSQC